VPTASKRSQILRKKRTVFWRRLSLQKIQNCEIWRQKSKSGEPGKPRWPARSFSFADLCVTITILSLLNSWSKNPAFPGLFKSYADCPPGTHSLQRSFGSRKSCKCAIYLRDAEGSLVVSIFCVMLRPNCSVRLCESWSLSTGCLTSIDSFKTYWNYVCV